MTITMKKIIFALLFLIQGFNAVSQVFTTGLPQPIDNTATMRLKGINLTRLGTITTPSLGFTLGNVGGNLSVKDSLGVTKTVATLEGTQTFTGINTIQNANGLKISDGTNYSWISNAGSRLVLSRPNSTTEALSVGGGNDELWIRGGLGRISHTGGSDFKIYAQTGFLSLRSDSYISHFIGGGEQMRMFSTGNIVLQNGGTFTDAGYKLDVNGTGRFTDNVLISSNNATKGYWFAATSVATQGFTANGNDINFLPYFDGIFSPQQSSGRFRPSVDNTSGLGTTSQRWNNIQVGTGTSSFGGNVGIGTTAPTSKLQVVGLPVYADNTAALSGGLTAGAFYRTSTGVLMVAY
jgi:hypothetical protein